MWWVLLKFGFWGFIAVVNESLRYEGDVEERSEDEEGFVEVSVAVKRVVVVVVKF